MTWEEILNHYEALIAQFPEVQRKGKTMPYTSLNGHMYSFIDKEGKMGLRLPKDERTHFIEKYDSQIMQQYGRMMKEYVVIPIDLLTQTKELEKYFSISLEYVGTLKPK